MPRALLQTPTTIIVLVACLAYAGTTGNELVLDDHILIPRHKALQTSPWNPTLMLGGRYWGDLVEQDTLYRPLTIWTLVLNAGLNRALGLPFDHPASYRLVNILLHAAVSVLLYRFAIRLGHSQTAGFFAALLFAVHPIHTEAVASIVNRSESLAAGFGLLFLILHHSRKQVGLGLCCLLLALSSKESALAFLPLAVWMDLMFKPLSPSRYGAYGLALIAWFGLRNLAVGGTLQAILPLDNPLAGAPLMERLLTAIRVQLDYLLLQFFPVHLSSDYSWNQIPVIKSPAHPHVIGFVCLVMVLLVLAWKNRRTIPHIPFAIGGYAILFSITSNLFFPIGTLMAERLAYAPSLFFCLLAGMGARMGIQKWRQPALYALILILLVLSGRTLVRNRDWSTTDRFYSAQVQSAPKSARAHYAIARSVYHKAGDLERALAHYRRAVQILPNFPDAWNNLGIAHKDRGDLQSAIQAFLQTIALHDRHREVYYNLGLVYQQQGDLEEARQAYETARNLNPHHPPTYNNLAALYIQRGEPEKARNLLQKALRLNPDYGVARQNLERLAPPKNQIEQMPK